VIQRVVIPSAHVNATGLAQSLRESGFAGPIVCLKHKANQRSIAERFPALCTVRLITKPESARLPDLLMEWFGGEETAVLFTDERYLQIFHDDGRFHLTRGPGSLLDTVLHKGQFYEFLRTNDLGPTPHTVDSSVDPTEIFPGVYRTRVWRSWDQQQKRPRGRLIRSKTDLAQWRDFAAAQGLTHTDWGYQAQLSTAPIHNVSVCGWHDESIQQYIVTRRIEVAAGLGWVVERIEDPNDLMAVTSRILDALSYVGPFELEFVLDLESRVYRVIELNPRFWMQHRLANVLTEHALVRRALGQRGRTTVKDGGPRYWIQPDVAITQPLRAARYRLSGIWGYPIKGSLAALIRRRLRR